MIAQSGKRLGALIALLMVAVLVLLACGGGSDSPPTAAGGDGATSTAIGEASTSAPAGSPTGTGGSTSDGGAHSDLQANLTGSGASFPDPLYQRWIEEYKSVAPGVTINYQSVGSGQGKNDFISGVTDFGGTDAYMTDEELAEAPDTLHIPTVLGAVTVTYNLPGVDDLRFSGPTLAGIFLGQITTWNDPAIAADNPGVELPDQPITVVYRSDGSGTTAIFTDYLTKVSEEWASQVGSGTAVQWPVGIGAEKNPGVTAAVQQTPGAIGYVELIYALANDLPAPAIKNAAGNYVTPSLESVSEAAAGFLADLPDDLRVSITNPPEGENAYPIAGFTWILVRGQYDDEAKARALTEFLYWALTEGDGYAEELHYAPLPDPVKELAIQKLEQVTVGGTPVFTSPAQ
ncbi:phosphate ABC transporter substrate-binding protein PstS [Sphaerobacter thermophilus]|uniref:phosphate ABC transporter substrate-binding protein PstS n=1 Tax=Sphaerobacter thermophilus TaxID=2057 RepID=UPI0039C44CEB